MKVPHSPSSSPEPRIRFVVGELRYGGNGPYSFEAAEAECLGLSGASGVGKTLLLRALADLDAHSGTIRLDGREHTDFPAPDWRRRVALVPAEPRWWHAEVEAHLPADHDRAAVQELVHQLGFADDVLHWQVSRLSTGEKQRLAAVRALSRRPEVLLLDETGSGLDRQNGGLLEEAIDTYRSKHGAVVLWVSHDSEQLGRVANRLCLIRRDGLEIVTRSRVTGEWS